MWNSFGLILLAILICFILVNLQKRDRLDAWFARRVIRNVTRITITYSCAMRCRCNEWYSIADLLEIHFDQSAVLPIADILDSMMTEVRYQIHNTKDNTELTRLRLIHDSLVGWNDKLSAMLSTKVYYRRYKIRAGSLSGVVRKTLIECT